MQHPTGPSTLCESIGHRATIRVLQIMDTFHRLPNQCKLMPSKLPPFIFFSLSLCLATLCVEVDEFLDYLNLTHVADRSIAAQL